MKIIKLNVVAVPQSIERNVFDIDIAPSSDANMSVPNSLIIDSGYSTLVLKCVLITRASTPNSSLILDLRISPTPLTTLEIIAPSITSFKNDLNTSDSFRFFF